MTGDSRITSTKRKSPCRRMSSVLANKTVDVQDPVADSPLTNKANISGPLRAEHDFFKAPGGSLATCSQGHTFWSK